MTEKSKLINIKFITDGKAKPTSPLKAASPSNEIETLKKASFVRFDRLEKLITSLPASIHRINGFFP